MSASFYDLLKYAKTGIAAPDMTAYDKMRAVAMGGGGAIKTLTGVPPLSFKSDGSALTDIIIGGNMVQSGTPSPQSLIYPSETGERTINVMPSAAAGTYENNGIRVVCNGFGRYTLSGTATSDAMITLNVQKFKTPISKGSGGNGAFRLFNDKIGSAAGDARLYWRYDNRNVENYNLHIADRQSDSYGNNFGGQYCDAIRFEIKSGISIENAVVFPMFVETGEIPDHYEPYGYKIPITCAGQTVPIYLGQTQTVRRIKKLVLTGQEETTRADTGGMYRYIVRTTLRYADKYIGLSTHYQYNFGTPSVYGYFHILSDGTGLAFFDNRDISADAFKQWLSDQYSAGTPVTVWYVLATPETAIVNEPLAKIGDYADELHSEDAGVSIPTVRGSNTLTVDTDLKPSSMTITYRE